VKISTSVRRGESWRRIAGTVLLLLAVIGGVAYAAFPIAIPFGWMGTPSGRVAVFMVGSMVGEAGAFVLLVRLLHRRGRTLADLGFGRPATLRATGFGLLVAIVYIAVTASNPAVGPHLFDFSALKLLAIPVAVVAGVVEETIFRGYVMTAIADRGRGPITQAVASGAVFGLAHLYGFSISPASYLITLAFTAALGTALGAVYLAGHRSLTPVILAHAVISLVIEPWLLLSFFAAPGS
jgi:membrane protease YdiL (CAAX protease family)